MLSRTLLQSRAATLLVSGASATAQCSTRCVAAATSAATTSTGGAHREQSTSTMGAVTGQQSHPLYAYTEKHDFSTAVSTECEEEAILERMHLAALVSAIQKNQAAAAELQQHQPEQATRAAKAVSMDLVEAAKAARDVESYDKILLLMRHGEAQHSVFQKKWAEDGNDPDMAEESEDYPSDPLLTGKGVGQALNLSRRTATFCNEQTGLIPDLFVTSPLRRSIQAAILAFPYLGPHSVTSKPWMVHGNLMERSTSKSDAALPLDALRTECPGVDYSEYQSQLQHSQSEDGVLTLEESKQELLTRTDNFLDWIRNRDERIIVVSSHSTWLQSFCGYTLKSEPIGQDSFKAGEMRPIGIKFDP